MKKYFNPTLLLLLAFPLISLSGCKGQNNNPSDFDPDEGQNEIPDQSENYDSISSAVAALKDSLTDDQKNTALPSSYESSVYAITAAGDYYFSGALSGAISVSKNAGNVHIYLDNVTLSVENDSLISSKKGANVTITLIGTNTLSNSGDSAKHVIDSKENLVINGSGTLTINSTKSAISCDKTFIGLGGTLNVTAIKHGVTGDSIYLNGTMINAINVGKDVLHAESDYDEVEVAPEFNYGAGFVFVENGGLNLTLAYGDAIQADSYVYIKGGTFNLTTTPTWNNNYVATENREKGMFDRNTHQKVARDSVRKGSTYAVLEESVKGIKVGEIDYYLASDLTNELTVESENYTCLIEGGTFNINCVDDAIHVNSGSALIYGGNLTINTSDDGIHADDNLKISGQAVIDIQSSYEGIEAETMDISGGDITVNALDDGLNATNSLLSESAQKEICQINISGGRLDVTVNPNGDRDGIDSNGGIKISGGTIIARGPNSSMACAIDASNTITISDGIVIVLGYAPGSSSGRGGPGGGGMGEGTLSLAADIIKTQSSSKGLSLGEHSVVVNGVSIEYENLYTYQGNTTVFAKYNATIN